MSCDNVSKVVLKPKAKIYYTADLLVSVLGNFQLFVMRKALPCAP